MKNKLLLIIASVILCASAKAQKINLLNNDENTEISQSSTTANVQIRISYIEISHFINGDDIYNVISSPILTPTLGKGEPMLPHYNKILEFEKSGDYTFVINKKDSTIIDLNKTSNGYKLKPAQKPTINSSKAENKTLIINDNAYSKDSLATNVDIQLTTIGTMRNRHLVRLDITPFNYNPVKNILVIYHSIDIKIYNKKSMLKSSQGEVIKSNSNTYLIITHPKFETSIERFATWKTMQGYNVKIAYATQDFTSNNDNIKNYIKDFYDNPPSGYAAPQYVLFAADETIIPSWEGRQEFPEIVTVKEQQTDLYYCDFTDDCLPEIMYGRLSATDAETMENIVDKIIKYETTDYENTDFLNRMVFISGVDADNAPIYSNTSLKYIYNNYTNKNGITSILYPYGESYGEMDCLNSGAAQSILNQINTGVGLLYYHGHGNPSSWDNPFITYDDINSSTENSVAGFWIANCCYTSKFNAPYCFAESVIRKKNGGAAGYIGAANQTIWEYDYMWLIGSTFRGNITDNYKDSQSGAADALYHTYINEQDIDNQYITAGEIVSRGNLSVTESGCVGYKYYWECFNLMGDPSMVVHYKKPEVNNVEYYPQNLIIGNEMLTIETVPYALCALSQDGVLIANAYANNDGTAMLQFAANQLHEGEATLVITAQNTTTYIEKINIFSAEKTMVGITSCRFSKHPAFNDSAYLSFDIKNLATNEIDENNALNIDINISCDNSHITIKKEMQPYPLLAPQKTASIDNAFKIIFAKDYPHNTNAKFKVNITFNDNQEQSYVISNIDVITPMIDCNYKNISDKGKEFLITSTIADSTHLENGESFEYILTTSSAAKIDGILEAGETAELTYNIKNTGKLNIDSTSAILTCAHKDITISNPKKYIKKFGSGLSVDITYQISLNENCKKSENIDFTLVLNFDGYPKEYTHHITANAQTEDFEHEGEIPNTLSVNSRRPWVISTSDPYSGKYCFESATIPDQANTYFKIDINNYQNDTITFWVKTSCEDYYAPTDTYFDHLEFAIDGEVKQKWAGVTPWTKARIPIQAGSHTLKWLYYKDGVGSENNDKVWVDNITFPPSSYINQNNIPSITATLPSWLTINDNGDGTAKISGISPNEYSIDNIVITAKYKQKTEVQKFSITTGKLDTTVSSNPKSDFVSIFPLPANNFITIEINGSLSYNRLRLFNSNGKIIGEQNIDSQQTTLYLTQCKSGIYILELNGDSGKLRRKIAVVK